MHILLPATVLTLIKRKNFPVSWVIILLAMHHHVRYVHQAMNALSRIRL